MLEILRGKVEPGWIDYNGHMNVAYYHVAFDRATERFLEKIGLGEGYVQREAGSMFALEDHLTYQRELKVGQSFVVSVQLLDFDEKRLHYFQKMHHAEEGVLAATCEHLSIYVDMNRRRSAPIPAKVKAQLSEIFESHRNLARPDEAGRPMGLRRG